MSTIVMKFGGAAVATPEMFSRCACIISEKRKKFENVIVVVSAMKGMTDHFLELVRRVNTCPPPREVDMLISVGERISMSLLAMALQKESCDTKSCEAVSFTGSQAGIITTMDHNNAKIIDVRPHRILPHLKKGKIAIVAGFQGVSSCGEITTLGRGGSDTTAVALGVKLKAEKVEFYKDVSGVYSADPKEDPLAEKHLNLDYDKAIVIVSKGAKVLHERSLHLAKKNALPLHVLSFQMKEKGTIIENQNVVPPQFPLFEIENLSVSGKL